MRLTLRSNLAMRTLMHCAVNSGRTVRKTDIARACGASENHLGLVILHLAQAGYVETVRGRNGGLICHKWRNHWLIEMVPMYA